MEKNTIFGYSERGIINSLIFSIGENTELINKFIGLITIPKPIEIGRPKYYTILLEQSFSDFGDADLVIIIHYEKDEDKKVLFFEGKVKTSLGSWNISTHYKKYIDEKEFKGYSSNLFYQLYFKSLLMENWDMINKNNEIEIDSKFRKRKIGRNEVVVRAFKRFSDFKEVFFIGIIPTLEEQIKKFECKTEYELYLLSWETVHAFCADNNLEKVLEIFEYNGEQIYKPRK